MTQNINRILTTFAQQSLVLGYKTVERQNILSSLDHLEKVIKRGLPYDVKNVIRFGSFTRNTILPRKFDDRSDVDLLIEFDGNLTPGTYRKRLRELLNKVYPNSISKSDFPAVKLELKTIKFDLVPSYTTQGIFGGTTDYIPGASDSWIETTPNDINKLLKEKNKNYGNNIVRNVIRLCKHWNASAHYPYSSYLMEKWIIERYFYLGDNLCEKFLNVLQDMAGNRPGVSQALQNIRNYQGGFFSESDEAKQLLWLKKLLPGL